MLRKIQMCMRGRTGAFQGRIKDPEAEKIWVPESELIGISDPPKAILKEVHGIVVRNRTMTVRRPQQKKA